MQIQVHLQFVRTVDITNRELVFLNFHLGVSHLLVIFHVCKSTFHGRKDYLTDDLPLSVWNGKIQMKKEKKNFLA